MVGIRTGMALFHSAAVSRTRMLWLCSAMNGSWFGSLARFMVRGFHEGHALQKKWVPRKACLVEDERRMCFCFRSEPTSLLYLIDQNYIQGCTRRLFPSWVDISSLPADNAKNAIFSSYFHNLGGESYHGSVDCQNEVTYFFVSSSSSSMKQGFILYVWSRNNRFISTFVWDVSWSLH